jgi:hypothetical protein
MAKQPPRRECLTKFIVNPSPAMFSLEIEKFELSYYPNELIDRLFINGSIIVKIGYVQGGDIKASNNLISVRSIELAEKGIEINRQPVSRNRQGFPRYNFFVHLEKAKRNFASPKEIVVFMNEILSALGCEHLRSDHLSIQRSFEVFTSLDGSKDKRWIKEELWIINQIGNDGPRSR